MKRINRTTIKAITKSIISGENFPSKNLEEGDKRKSWFSELRRIKTKPKDKTIKVKYLNNRIFLLFMLNYVNQGL